MRRHKLVSVNNHALDFEKLGNDFRITRFIRDPRDLVISGYFYHKRGAEQWCNVRDPDEKDWVKVNGAIPENMGEGHSYSSYLQSINIEDGLIAEIDFREKHFESMTAWPVDDDRIKLFRYEDILGKEIETFNEIFSFYGISGIEKKIGIFFANKYSAGKQEGSTAHIRNPRSGQWKQHFTPKVKEYFDSRYEGLLAQYNYDHITGLES